MLSLMVMAAPAMTVGTATGDGSWLWLNPSPQGNPLKAVSFIDANTGWAAGVAGTILKTTDGGATWSTSVPSTNCLGIVTSGCNLTSISFIDSTHGVAVGEYGTIWKTADGGSTWAARTLPSTGCSALPGGSCATVLLASVQFIDASNVVAVGAGYGFYSADGGTTWNVASGIDPTVTIDSVSMTGTNGYAVGSFGAIYQTTDSGHTWPVKMVSPVALNEIRAVYTADATHAFAISGSQLLRTTDGLTWTASSGLSAQLYGLTVSGNDLVVTGTSGTILKRTSATNWTDPIATVASGMTASVSGTTSLLFDVVYAGGSAYASGDAGAVVKSIDSGATWTLKAGGNSKSFMSSSFVNDSTGWVTGRDGTVLKTTDSGATWTSDRAGIATGTTLQAVQFLDASTGFTAGYYGASGVIYKYSAGTWAPMTMPAGVSQIWGLHMVDPTHGWAVGFPGTGATTGVALKTVDGQNWVFDAAGLGANIQLYSVDSTSAANAWAVGQNTITRKGVVARYSGGVWTVTEKTELNGMQSIDMVNDLTGFFAAYGPPSGTNYGDGKVYKTTDGGLTWNNTALSTTHVMAATAFIDANTGYVAGGEGRVFKTVNGGATWTLESLGSGSRMFSISIVPSINSLTGYVAYTSGDSASILRTPMCTGGKPNLSLRNTGTYWASYSDYTWRTLSVDYSLTNSSTATAYAVSITGSSANNGVVLDSSSPMPMSLGDIVAGGSQPLTLKYSVPDGLTSFKAYNLASAQDGCGGTYTYP
ncbi:MAG: YCF48-related protein [Actinobacteria bacterium]|nr:YCF48-related protein [Actinomycetota bacterium]